MTTEHPAPSPGVRYYDADHAPPGETNVMNHGWDVIDANGKQIGKVDQVYDNGFTIAEGFIIHDLYFAPFSIVAGVDLDHHKVHLNVTNDQFEAMDTDAYLDAAQFGTADNFVVGQGGSSREGGIIRPAAGAAGQGAATTPPPTAAATPPSAMERPATAETPVTEDRPETRQG